MYIHILHIFYIDIHVCVYIYIYIYIRCMLDVC